MTAMQETYESTPAAVEAVKLKATASRGSFHSGDSEFSKEILTGPRKKKPAAAVAAEVGKPALEGVSRDDGGATLGRASEWF